MARFVVGLFLLAQIFVVPAVLLISIPAHAQNNISYLYATGSPTFTTAEPVELGFINLGNGNLHLEIPIASLPQRGLPPYTAKLVYDSRIWTHGSSWSPTNVLDSSGNPSQGGWRFVTSLDTGSVDDNLDEIDCDGLEHLEPPAGAKALPMTATVTFQVSGLRNALRPA